MHITILFIVFGVSLPNQSTQVEQLVQRVCNYKQAYTQYGGLRPFGVAFLFGGYDVHFGYQVLFLLSKTSVFSLRLFQLYMSDPSGNYSGWKATCIGQNNQAGKSLLKNEYEEGLDLDQGLKLATKVLLKTMDATAATSDKFEFAVLSASPDGKVCSLRMKSLSLLSVFLLQCTQYLVDKEHAARILEEVNAQAAPEGDA